jgi:colicin import membrane protein
VSLASAAPQKDPFQRFIVISLGAHVCLIAFFTLRAVVFPSEPIQIRSAIRVDMVALPEKQSPKPAAPPAAAPKVEIKKPAAKEHPKNTPKKTAKPKVDLKQTKAQQQEALNRLKALEAIEKFKEAEAAKQKTQEYKGNVVTEGSSLTGLAQIEFDRYLSQIETNIRQNWNLPKWLEDANLRAQVRVMIDERGYVINKKIETSSGNESFDDTVIAAVEKASPLPPPPDRLKNVLSTRGFVLNFPE